MGWLDSIYPAFVLATLLCGTQAFLPTKLNFSDPIANDIFCPDQMEGKNWDLKVAILINSLIRFLYFFIFLNISIFLWFFCGTHSCLVFLSILFFTKHVSIPIISSFKNSSLHKTFSKELQLILGVH